MGTAKVGLGDLNQVSVVARHRLKYWTGNTLASQEQRLIFPLSVAGPERSDLSCVILALLLPHLRVGSRLHARRAARFPGRCLVF